MGRRTIYGLIAVMTLALTFLIIVQMNIINSAAKIKEEQFSQLVRRCLMKVASRLEEEEKRQFLLTEHMMNQRFGFQTGIDPVSSTMADLINHRQINISFNAKKDDRGNMKTEVTYEELQTGVSRSDFPISNPGAFDPISELSDYERERYFQRVRSQDIMTRSVQYQLMMANRPIEKRIDPKLLEELIREEFVSNGILLDYEFVVKSYFQGNEKVIFGSGNYKAHRKKEHQTPLFTNDIVSQKPNYLKVYFPNSQKHFLASTGIMVLPTIALVLLIVGIFAYTIVVILRQKKLSIIKNDFINNMTHELKTPISTISLASQMLRDNGITNTPATISRISGVIYDESKRLSMQVEKVLQMAIFNEGRLKMKFKSFDLHEVVTTAVQNFEIRVQNANGTISLEKNATKCIIYGDQVHITNVLFNLLDNAVKYRREQLEIKVETENRKEQVLVSVSDNGIGIAKEHQKQIFERFFRVPTGNLHDVKGFGLGLHYASKIMEAHQGELKVESALNKGTTFTISFPIKE